MRVRGLAVLGAVVLTIGSVGAAGAQTVSYMNDFSSAVNPPGAAGTWSTTGTPTIYTREGSTSLGHDQSYFTLNQTATLNFSGLGAYTGGSVAFTVRLWDTWDAAGNCCGPDRVQFRVNGGPLLMDEDFGFFGNNGAFNRSFAFGAGTGSLSLQWLGATTQTDEGFTLDNVSVRIDQVQTNLIPEPSTYALLATGLAAVGTLARRRRTAR